MFGEPGVAKASRAGHGDFIFNDITPDTLNGAKFIRDLYDMVGTTEGRYSVPLLWDI